MPLENGAFRSVKSGVTVAGSFPLSCSSPRVVSGVNLEIENGEEHISFANYWHSPCHTPMRRFAGYCVDVDVPLDNSVNMSNEESKFRAYVKFLRRIVKP
jgi:hypothetical protein